MEKLREEFEGKLSHDYGDDALLKNSDGDYVDWLTADLWDYWQSSRASIVVELPEMEDFELLDGYKVRESIRSIGLSIKGE